MYYRGWFSLCDISYRLGDNFYRAVGTRLNESLKEATGVFSEKKINENLLFLLFLLKNIFHSNDKIVIALKTSYSNMEYFSWYRVQYGIYFPSFLYEVYCLITHNKYNFSMGYRFFMS